MSKPIPPETHATRLFLSMVRIARNGPAHAAPTDIMIEPLRYQALWHTLCSRDCQHIRPFRRGAERAITAKMRVFAAPDDSYPAQWTMPRPECAPPVGPSLLTPEIPVSTRHRARAWDLLPSAPARDDAWRLDGRRSRYHPTATLLMRHADPTTCHATLVRRIT